MRRLARNVSAAVALTAAAGTSALAQTGVPPLRARTPDMQTAALRAGALSGIVSDERGGPVRGAMVTVAGATTALTVSDERGYFQVETLPAGEYVLRAHLAGFAPSPRQVVQVGAAPTQHRLQVRRLDAAVGTAGTAPTIASREIIAAGFELPRGEAAPAPSTEAAGKGTHPHSEIAWRLRHIKRSILKDTSNAALVVETDEAPPSGSMLGRAFSSANAFASALFTELPLSGEVNLLTTGAFGEEMWSSPELPRGVAYFSLGSPTPAGNWLVRGAMSEGDLSSWIVAGSFVSRPGRHSYELGLTYSTQEYLGGNPAALVAVKDGSRNVGEIRGLDRWVLTPGLTVEYGGRYARHDYLDQRSLLSPQVGMTLHPTKSTRVRARLAQRMVAPGAEEFLQTHRGPWLPPERTFAPLVQDAGFEAERARSLDVEFEHEIAGAYVLGVRRFFQEVDDQMVTMFGLRLPDGPRSVGHYYVASAGALDATGWGVRLSSPADHRVRAVVDYSLTDTRWHDRDDVAAIARWAPSAVRPDQERVHDLTTSVETDFPETSTRLFLLYKLNSAFTRAAGNATAPGTDGRFDLQVHQALPFELAGTQWEVLVGLRNLFRDPKDPASVYDELLVLRPPKRVIGGFLVRF